VKAIAKRVSMCSRKGGVCVIDFHVEPPAGNVRAGHALGYRGDRKTNLRRNGFRLKSPAFPTHRRPRIHGPGGRFYFAMMSAALRRRRGPGRSFDMNDSAKPWPGPSFGLHKEPQGP